MNRYSHVVDGTIVQTGKPTNLRRLDTGESVLVSDTISDELLAACGWLPLVVEAQPVIDESTQVVTRQPPTLVNGVPTIAWVVRPKTQEELDSAAVAAADEAERTQVKNGIAQINAFLALSNTQKDANLREAVVLALRAVKRLARDQYGD